MTDTIVMVTLWISESTVHNCGVKIRMVIIYDDQMTIINQTKKKIIKFENDHVSI